MRLPSWFLNTSVGSRLGWGFAALVGLTLAYGGLTLSQMRDLAGQANLLFRHPFTVTRAVDEVELQVLKVHREMKDLAHTLELEDVQQHLARVGAYEKEALRQLEIARERFQVEERGEIQVKGKGTVRTYLIADAGAELGGQRE